FPPSRIVVMRCDFVESELLVIVRTDPFRTVDRAFLERRVDVAAGDLLGDRAELLHHAPGKAANTEFETLEVVDSSDFLAEPAAHLTAGVAGQQRDDIVLFIELVEDLFAAAQ